MIESGLPFNKFIMVPSQHSDLGTVAADIARVLSEKLIAVFVEGEEDPEDPCAKVSKFIIDEDGLSFSLPSVLIPSAALRPHLVWGFCEGCEGFAIRFCLPLGSKGSDDD